MSDYVFVADARKKFLPCVPDVVKDPDGFTVTLETGDVRKYILAKVQDVAARIKEVEKEIASGQEEIMPFADLFLPFADEYALRILNAAPGFVNSDLYSGRQTDLTTWLYGKLREADENRNSTIQFRITQVFII